MHRISLVRTKMRADRNTLCTARLAGDLLSTVLRGIERGRRFSPILESMTPDSELRARLALSFLAAPGDTVLGAALRTRSADEVLAAVTGADSDGAAMLASAPANAALTRAMSRWRDRLAALPRTWRLASWQDSGLRLIVPGDAEWPTQLDDLGDARPLLLWLRGAADLRLTCVNSVSMVGARAATGYGNHVAMEMAATLGERGFGVVSGGPYAIDPPR
jgi:DNA processing protein